MMTAGDLSQGPTIKLDGAVLPVTVYADLIDVRVEHTLSMASTFSMRFRDPDFALLDSNRFAVGAAIEISFPGPRDQPVTVIEGDVVSLSCEQGHGERHELVVSGYDASHRLGHESKVRSFQNMSYADVIRTIAREHGLKAEVDPKGVATVFPYLLQASTDRRFLADIAFRVGYEWWIEGKTLVFRDRAWDQGTTLRFGDTLRRFKARYSAAEHASGVTVRGWNPSTMTSVVATDTATLKQPTMATRGSDATLAAPRGSWAPVNKSVNHSAAVFEVQDEATQYAASLARRRASAQFSARGEAIGQPTLRAGHTVTVSNVGTSLAGTYYLTSVEHIFGAGRPLITRFTVGGREASTLVDLLGRGDDPVGRWGQLGLTVGIVTNNKDPNGWGRVRLKFPALSDDTESGWARVATPGGGQGRGLMFVPEIHDEVLVAFEHGDLRRPYVLGGLWNSKHAPPLAPATFLANGKVVEWVIKSRRGHVVTMRDGESSKTGAFDVILHDGKTKLHVGEDKVELWSNNKPLELKAGDATVTLDGTGNLTIKGKNITIDAQQALNLAGNTVSVKGRTSTKVEAGAGLELKGNAPSKLECASILEVKGTLLKFN